MAVSIHLATESHVPGMLAIYGPVVEGTAISFELAVPTVSEFASRVEQVQADLPWLVCEDGDVLLGYAYATRFRTRAAYAWSVETAVYVHPAYRRRGVARGLYASLLALLRVQGYHVAIAGITLPNPGSVRLHEALGFAPVGAFGEVGFKHGAWHGVGFWQAELAPSSREPAPPLSLCAIREAPACEDALAQGAALVR